MSRFAIVLVFFSLCASAWPDIRVPRPDFYSQAKMWLAEELYDIPEEERVQSVQKLLKDTRKEIDQEYQRREQREQQRDPIRVGRSRRKAFNAPLEYRVLLMKRWLDKRGVVVTDDMASSDQRFMFEATDTGVELDFDAVARKRSYRPPSYLKNTVATKEQTAQIKAREKRIAESAAKAHALAAKADTVGEKSEKTIKKKIGKEDTEAKPLQPKASGEQGADSNQDKPGYAEESSSSNRPGILIAGALLFFGVLLGLRRLLAAQ